MINPAGPRARPLAAAGGADAPGLEQSLLAWNVAFRRFAPAAGALAVRAPRKGARTWFLVPADGILLAGTGYAPWRGGCDDLTLPEACSQRS